MDNWLKKGLILAVFAVGAQASTTKLDISKDIKKIDINPEKVETMLSGGSKLKDRSERGPEEGESVS